ncbi:hypothetical protein [Paenarthrobacter sp. YAF11_1]|uniref:hypothetical protein n=1 Tax=Paenarthrobacter sp. YAF11_1 TaxID=3233074 RepID=UPI003F9B24BD
MEPSAAGTRAAIRIFCWRRGLCSITNAPRTATPSPPYSAAQISGSMRVHHLGTLRSPPLQAWRSSHTTEPVIRIVRAEAKRLALAVKDLNIQVAENHKALAQLTQELAPGP